MNPIGGITTKDVLNFQIKIMMGSQYDRVVSAKDEKDVIIACLRMAWNDAFRHVSKNRYKNDQELIQVLYGNDLKTARQNAAKDLNLSKEKLDDPTIVSEYICQKILADDVVYNTFLSYAKSETSEKKAEVVVDAMKNKQLRQKFAAIKDIENSEYPLCFGHFQKLFNMAMKLYLCLYVSKPLVDIIRVSMGSEITAQMLEHADCPIDSIILKKLDKTENAAKKIKQVAPYCKTNKKGEYVSFSKFEEIKWSKLGKFEIPGFSPDEAPNELHFAVAHYVCVQEVIHEAMGSKSNLCFDFENWQ